MNDVVNLDEQRLKKHVERLQRFRELTPEQLADWSMPPVNDRAGITALTDGENVVYVDGQGNPLEPGWVVRILRGDDLGSPLGRAQVEAHPWMQARSLQRCPHEPKHADPWLCDAYTTQEAST
jgi:hypothetical protein